MDDPTLAALNQGQAPNARIERVDRHDDGKVHVERFRLGNGLDVIVWEDRGAPVLAYHTWFKVGSRHDPAGKTGIAHLFEHLMFKATKTHPEGEYDKVMEARGGQTNAATWVDWTQYRAKLPRWELGLVTAWEADRMENLALDKDMLEREREVVKNERLMRVDNDPDGLLSERLFKTVFERHPYGAPTIGWMADIEAIDLDDCMHFYRKHYAPNNAAVVVVGDVRTDEVLRAVQAAYGHLPAEAREPEPVVIEAPQTAERRLEQALPLAASRLVMAYRSMAAGSAEHAALDVAVELLVGGDSARLHRALVEDLELATDVSGWVSGWAQPGVLELSMTLRPGADLAHAEAALDAKIDEFLEGPIADGELEKAKNGLEASFLRGQADVGSRARALGHGWATLDDWQDLWAGQARLQAVTAEDVLRAARAVLRREQRTVAIAKPSGEPAVAGEADGDDAGGGDAGDETAEAGE
ncbi:MAG: pitrilysin family protein [Myxococcota bacterium]